MTHPKIVTFDRADLEVFAARARSDGTGEFLAHSVIIFIASRDELFERMRIIDENSGGIFPRSFLEKLPRVTEPICAGWTTRKAMTDWHIYRGFLFIEYPGRLHACLYEELMQSFGIPNDFPDGTPSIFNDDNVFDEPTELDLLLWRVHSDTRLEAGMTEQQVRPTAREIIIELLAQGGFGAQPLD